jgi:hypothetical protein
VAVAALAACLFQWKSVRDHGAKRKKEAAAELGMAV